MLLVLAGLSYFRACRPQHVLLVVASYVFYAWLDVRFIILLLISSHNRLHGRAWYRRSEVILARARAFVTPDDLAGHISVWG